MNIFDSPDHVYDRILLEQLLYGMQQRVDLGPGLQQTLQLETIKDEYEHMYLRLSARLLAHQLGGETIERRADLRVEYSYPATWWQMWKSQYQFRWYARWLVKRWPVRYVKPVVVEDTATLRVDVKDYATFPKATIAYPEGRLGTEVFMRQVHSNVTHDRKRL